MGQLRKHQGAFTLIELLVVVIIVAILAAVGIPLLTGNTQKARASEADAGLGAIRTAMRVSLAQNGVYPTLTGTQASAASIGINAGDLNGHYFSDASYTITSPRSGSGTFCASADGSTSAAVQAAQVQSPNLIQHSIDESGTIHDASTNCTGVALN